MSVIVSYCRKVWLAPISLISVEVLATKVPKSPFVCSDTFEYFFSSSMQIGISFFGKGVDFAN